MLKNPKTSLSNKPLLGSLGLTLYLSSVYIGDFSVDGTNISPFLLGVVAFLLVFLSRPKIRMTSVMLWIMFVLFSLALTLKISMNDYYAVIFSVVLFPLVYFLVKPLIRPSPLIVIGSAMILVMVTAILISAGGAIGTRTSIIFGPNILYRVLATFIALALFVPCERNAITKLCTLVGVLVGVYGILLTGSRGGILELLFILTIWILQTRLRIIWAVSTLSILLILVSAGTVDTLFPNIRQFRFSTDLASIAVRIDSFASVRYFLELPIKNVLFGYPEFKSLTYIMPHNLFLEGLLAWGAIFTIILAIGTGSYFFHFALRIRAPHFWWIDIPLITTFVGAQVSGTYAHNYSAITLALIGNIFLSSKRKTKTMQRKDHYLKPV